MEHTGDVTRLLRNWQQGDSQAQEELMPLVYRELRDLAASYLRKERRGHTLQVTDVVHEAYVRLSHTMPLQLNDRSHFFTVAARAMRRLLVDHARRKQAGKRIDPAEQIPLDRTPELAVEPNVDVLAVHEAIEDLSQIHPRQATLVELRYFGGLTMDEAADVLEVSEATLARDWRVARVWLRQHLSSS